MALLDSLVALGVVGVVAFVVVSLLVRGTGTLVPDRPALLPGSGGRWQVAHYELGAATRVVVRKVLPDGVTVVDEHVVATVRQDDPAYDATFLDAMARARARVALFQSEED